MEKLGSHWKDFNEILNLSIFPMSVGKIPSLKSDKKNRHIT
jgi:hypothetical protein